MKILLTGANAQLGMALREASRGSGDNWLFSDIASAPGLDTLYLDITNPDAVSLVLRSEKPDVIINCADDRSLPDQLRHLAPASLSAMARENGAVLIHFSWADVLDSTFPLPQQESFPARPGGPLGAAALQGEDAILASGCRAIIFRTQWIYSRFGKNLVKSFLQGRPGQKVPYDVLGSPTSARELAALVAGIVAQRRFDAPGLYHYSGEGVCSLYDLAFTARRLMGIEGPPTPCRASQVREYSPSCVLLDKAKVKKTFGIRIPHWSVSLENCLQLWNSQEKK